MPYASSQAPPGTLAVQHAQLRVVAFANLPAQVRAEIIGCLDRAGEDSRYIEHQDLIVNIRDSGSAINALLGRELHRLGIRPNPREARARSIASVPIGSYSDPIDFDHIAQRSHELADVLEDRTERVSEALRCYETQAAAVDEIARSVNLLRNLHENRPYFVRRVHGVTTFLPQNQPLYSTICFSVVPAYMAHEAVTRPPAIAQKALSRLREIIPFRDLVPQLQFSYQSKQEFIRERAARTDVVIFTGRAQNAYKVRRQFDSRALFILNGAGHNPIVVTESADIERAVSAILRVTLHNQGQDCSAPNAILVHRSVAEKVKQALIVNLEGIESCVGPTSDPSNIIGPNTDPDHVVHIARVFASNRQHCVYGGTLNPIDGLIRPALFEKPLKSGGSFIEFYAPVLMLQPYDEDTDLHQYFEAPPYAEHSMYVTVFGQSPYVNAMVERGLVERTSLILDSDLHIQERGFLPYGGIGPAASCVFIENRRITGPTLPQRDIFQYLVSPALEHERDPNDELRRGSTALVGGDPPSCGVQMQGG